MVHWSKGGGPFKHGFSLRGAVPLEKVFLPLFQVFRVVYSHSISASNIPTLNFAKDAKFRMGHPPVLAVRFQDYR